MPQPRPNPPHLDVHPGPAGADASLMSASTSAPRPAGAASEDSPALREYLARVRAHLPVRCAPDVLLELKTSILDRADAIALAEDRDADESVIARALGEVGEPDVVAAGYVPVRHVVEPSSYRAFVMTIAILLGIHLVLLAVATSLGRALQAGPVAITPVGDGSFSFGGAILHALVMDVGLATIAFWGLPRVRNAASLLPSSFRVDAAPRAAGSRALLSALVAVVLAFFRDDVFVLVNDGTYWPLITPWFAAVMPLVLALLIGAVVSDVFYLVCGETRATLAVDALHGAATVAVMVHLARGEALMHVPAVDAFDVFRAPLDAFLDRLGTLIVVFLAVVAAVKTVRRLVRFAQV